MVYMTPLPVPWPSVQWHPEVLEKGTYPHQFVCVAPGTLTLYSVGEDHHLDVWGPSGLLLLGCSFLLDCLPCAVHVLGPSPCAVSRLWKWIEYCSLQYSDPSVWPWYLSSFLVWSLFCWMPMLARFSPFATTATCPGFLPRAAKTATSRSTIWLLITSPSTRRRFWDTLIGTPSTLLFILSRITSLHFNPIYDQFLLSSSTDCSLCLWKLFSISSAIYKETPYFQSFLLYCLVNRRMDCSSTLRALAPPSILLPGAANCLGCSVELESMENSTLVTFLKMRSTSLSFKSSLMPVFPFTISSFTSFVLFFIYFLFCSPFWVQACLRSLLWHLCGPLTSGPLPNDPQRKIVFSKNIRSYQKNRDFVHITFKKIFLFFPIVLSSFFLIWKWELAAHAVDLAELETKDEFCSLVSIIPERPVYFLLFESLSPLHDNSALAPANKPAYQRHQANCRL